MILGKIGEKVGGGVGIHFLDDVGGALGVERFDDGSSERLGSTSSRVSAATSSSRVRKTASRSSGARSSTMSAMSAGWSVGQAFVRNLELDAAGRIGFDEIDESSRGWCGGGIFCSRTWRAARGASPRRRRRMAPRAPISTECDAQDGVRVSSLGDGVDLEFDVVDAHDFASVECR